MRRAWILGSVVVASVVFAAASACTGDDPNISPRDDAAGSDGATSLDGSELDAAVPDGSQPVDAASDADAGSCAMRMFSAPASIALPTDFAYGPRFYERDGGTRMLYVSTAGADGHQIHEGAPSGGTSYTFDEAVTNVNSAADEWAPAPTRDGTFMVFARGPVGNRDLYGSVRTGGAFGTPTLLTSLQRDAGDEDADGYLLADGSAYYFASNRGGTNGLGIYRAARAGAAPSFDAPIAVLAAGSGTQTLPVVDSAETTMLYLSSVTTNPSNGDIWETALGADHRATGQPMLHSELSVNTQPDAPAFLSPDGCTLYFQRGFGPGTTVFVARR